MDLFAVYAQLMRLDRVSPSLLPAWRVALSMNGTRLNSGVLATRGADKKHANYIKGLIMRCEEELPLNHCDRAVCHFLMRSFMGLDAAGKRKISNPKRIVLSPDEMSNPAAYGEHCEWITYVAPRLEAPIIEFHTDEDGQAWQLTYSMDPGSRGPKMDRIDPVTRLPLPGGRQKRRRIR